MSDQPKPRKEDAAVPTGGCTCDNSASDVIIDQYCPKHGSLKPTGEALDEYGYPLNWPKCPNCGLPAMDGHVTCGRVECNEGSHR